MNCVILAEVYQLGEGLGVVLFFVALYILLEGSSYMKR